VSRGGVRPAGAAESAGTPIWVWIVYSAGILGALALLGSAVASAALVLFSDATVRISFPALVVSLVLVGAAVALKVWRSRRSSA
jgi:hypothetical protein